MRVWSRALATGELLEPEVWAEAQKDPVPFVFAGKYNGPGTWSYGLGFVETGGFIGGEGSFAGYESTTMYPRAGRRSRWRPRRTPAITPPPMFQALAMAVYGPDIGFGLTPEQALEPTYTGGAG
ncbi:hypothetical protein ABZ946_13690 [Streptomyces sp. NPDC046324]|uniref:hypothetical protein n=1 Tax=Streptomyces sp. NPDC046324 TaxID=3154915 RepID=UPI0033C6C383